MFDTSFHQDAGSNVKYFLWMQAKTYGPVWTLLTFYQTVFSLLILFEFASQMYGESRIIEV